MISLLSHPLNFGMPKKKPTGNKNISSAPASTATRPSTPNISTRTSPTNVGNQAVATHLMKQITNAEDARFMALKEAFKIRREQMKKPILTEKEALESEKLLEAGKKYSELGKKLFDQKLFGSDRSMTALHRAMQHGCPQFTNWLLEGGAKLDAIDSNGDKPAGLLKYSEDKVRAENEKANQAAETDFRNLALSKTRDVLKKWTLTQLNASLQNEGKYVVEPKDSQHLLSNLIEAFGKEVVHQKSVSVPDLTLKGGGSLLGAFAVAGWDKIVEDLIINYKPDSTLIENTLTQIKHQLQRQKDISSNRSYIESLQRIKETIEPLVMCKKAITALKNEITKIKDGQKTEDNNFIHAVKQYIQYVDTSSNLIIDEETGDTALLFAARKGCLKSVQLLLENDFDPKVSTILKQAEEEAQNLPDGKTKQSRLQELQETRVVFEKFSKGTAQLRKMLLN